jgi:hypothetical protein
MPSPRGNFIALYRHKAVQQCHKYFLTPCTQGIGIVEAAINQHQNLSPVESIIPTLWDLWLDQKNLYFKEKLKGDNVEVFLKWFE